MKNKILFKFILYLALFALNIFVSFFSNPSELYISFQVQKFLGILNNANRFLNFNERFYIDICL